MGRCSSHGPIPYQSESPHRHLPPPNPWPDVTGPAAAQPPPHVQLRTPPPPTSNAVAPAIHRRSRDVPPLGLRRRPDLQCLRRRAALPLGGWRHHRRAGRLGGGLPRFPDSSPGRTTLVPCRRFFRAVAASSVAAGMIRPGEGVAGNEEGVGESILMTIGAAESGGVMCGGGGSGRRRERRGKRATQCATRLVDSFV